MHRNIARACDALWAEQERIRAIHMRILSQSDSRLRRWLLAQTQTTTGIRYEALLYEECLSGPRRRRVLKLNSYGRKIEQVMETLLRL
jgi:hypothetical protein